MTAADQPPAELVEKAARAIHDRICDCPDYGNGCGRWPTEDAEHVLAAVWPLVQQMVRDAQVETLDELGVARIERGARDPGCLVWVNHDGTAPDNLVDGQVVERTVYYSPWREVQS